MQVPDATPVAPQSKPAKTQKKTKSKQPKQPSGTRKSISAQRQKASSKSRKAVERAAKSSSRSKNTAVEQAALSTERQGRRVGDIRARERAERNRKRYRSYLMKIGIVVGVILIVFFGAIFLYRSPAFTIKNVEVTGVSHLTDQEITQLAAVPDDSTLLRLDSAGICQRLESHAWIQKVTIKRHLPDTIELVVTERTPAAVVRLNADSIWVISTDGAWLSAATEEDWNTNRRIVDVSTSVADPVSGNDCSDEGIKNAVAIYDGVSDELAAMIDSISAGSAVKAALYLTNGVTVAFGEAEDMDLKEAAVWELLDQFEGTISYINVRTPERPTYRTMSSQSSSSDDEEDDE